MTERKPQGMSFTSWVDQQINEAMERGAFDNLAGAGKPLPRRGEADDAEAWALDYARREGLPTEEMLPTPLKLRKQIHLLTESVHLLRSEQDVSEAVADLNRRIIEWRKIPLGPPIFVPLVDEEQMLARWRDRQPAAPPAATAAAPSQAPAAERVRPRWRRSRGAGRL